MLKLWRKPEVANDNVEDCEDTVLNLRSTERRMIYREAFVHLPEAVRIQVVAMDISPLGARIRLPRVCRLPEIVSVTVLDEVKKQPARIAWNDGNDVGLEFLNPQLDADSYLNSLSGPEFDN